MSKATKRKHVTKEVLDDYVLPEDDQQIVKVVASKGNNLHEVETASKEKFLASMPTKFRKNIWIKRGDYVMTEPIEEGDKVKAEIVHILYRDQIKYIIQEGKWPEEFDDDNKNRCDEMIPSDMLPPSGSDSESEEGDMISANPNRPHVAFQDEEDSSEEDVNEDNG